MAQACADRPRGHGRVTPAVVPGVSMSILVEAVEHQLRIRGSRCPSFPTHIFTCGRAPARLGRRDGAGSRCARARSSSSTSAAVVDGLLLRLRPHDPLRRAAGRLRGGSRRDARGAGGRTCRQRSPARSRATSTPPAARRSRKPASAAGFRHRMGHGIGLDVHERPFLSPEDETPLEARDDVHGRAVDHRRRQLRRPRRGRDRGNATGGSVL